MFAVLASVVFLLKRFALMKTSSGAGTTND